MALRGTIHITLANMLAVCLDRWSSTGLLQSPTISVGQCPIKHGTVANTPSDSGPILLTDHYHREYFDIIKDVMSTDISKVVCLRRPHKVKRRY